MEGVEACRRAGKIEPAAADAGWDVDAVLHDGVGKGISLKLDLGGVGTCEGGTDGEEEEEGKYLVECCG